MHYSRTVMETGYWGQEVCVLHCSFCMYNRLFIFSTTVSCVPLRFLSHNLGLPLGLSSFCSISVSVFCPTDIAAFLLSQASPSPSLLPFWFCVGGPDQEFQYRFQYSFSLLPFLYLHAGDRCGQRHYVFMSSIPFLWMYNRLFVLKITVSCVPLRFQQWERKRQTGEQKETVCMCLLSCRCLPTPVMRSFNLLDCSDTGRIHDTRDRRCFTSAELMHSLPSDHVKEIHALISLQSRFSIERCLGFEGRVDAEVRVLEEKAT